MFFQLRKVTVSIFRQRRILCTIRIEDLMLSCYLLLHFISIIHSGYPSYESRRFLSTCKYGRLQTHQPPPLSFQSSRACRRTHSEWLGVLNNSLLEQVRLCVPNIPHHEQEWLRVLNNSQPEHEFWITFPWTNTFQCFSWFPWFLVNRCMTC